MGLRSKQVKPTMGCSKIRTPMQMSSIPYRIENGTGLIEIKLDSVAQFFNSLDPAPFRAKDLDADAEVYVVDAAEELSGNERLAIVLYLPDDEAQSEQARAIPDAVHNYFEYRQWASQRELKRLFRLGRITLAIGIGFLFVCLGLSRVALAMGDGILNEVISEGLFICSWVAMWRPIEVFLFEWWPIRAKSNIYARLKTVPVDIRASAV